MLVLYLACIFNSIPGFIVHVSIDKIYYHIAENLNDFIVKFAKAYAINIRQCFQFHSLYFKTDLVRYLKLILE